MDVVIYTDSNRNVPLNAYTRLIKSVNLLFEDKDLHFILYSLDTDIDTKILVNMIDDLNVEYPNKKVTHDVILRPSYIKEYTPENDTGGNLLIEDNGLFAQLNVLKHEDALFIRVDHTLASDIKCDKSINKGYDVSGLLIKTRLLKKILETVKLDNLVLTGEMLRLLVDTFVDPSEIVYYSTCKDVYYTFNEIHKESLWDLYSYLVNDIYPKMKHIDQYSEISRFELDKKANY